MSFLNPSLPASEYADIACHNLTMTGTSTGTFNPTPKSYITQYSLSAQSILAGQPIQFDLNQLDTGVGVDQSIITAPFTSAGTIFTLPYVGVYEITYSVTCTNNGTTCLFFSPSAVAPLARVIPSTVGRSSGDATDISQLTNTILLRTTVINQKLAVCNANTSLTLTIPVSVNADANSTIVSILQVS